MKTLLFVLVSMMTIASSIKEEHTLIRYKTTLAKKPDSESKNVRVWNIRKTDTIRINLVEFSGELPMHKHPDADHSLSTALRHCSINGLIMAIKLRSELLEIFANLLFVGELHSNLKNLISLQKSYS